MPGGKEQKFLLPEYKAKDMIRIRNSLNLPQCAFANVPGVPFWTVEEWEAGYRLPTGPARQFLYIIESDLSLADKL